MDTPTSIGLGLSLAFALAFLCAGLAGFFGRDGDSPTGPRWGLALGVGLGYLLGHTFISEWHVNERPRETWKSLLTWTREGGTFPLSAVNAWDWIPWIVVGTTLLGLLDGHWPAPRWARWQNRLIFSGLLVWLILSSQIELLGVRGIVGFGAAVFLFWTMLDLRAERLGASMPLVLLLPAIGLAVAQGLSRSYVIGSLTGAIAASMGGLWIVAWFNPRMNLARAAVPTYAMVFAGLTLSGVYLSELPKSSAILLTLAPLASIVDRIRFGASRSETGESIVDVDGWRHSLVRVVVMLIPISIAMGLAFAYVPKSGPYGK